MPKKIDQSREGASLKYPVPAPETDNPLAALVNRTLFGTTLGIAFSIDTLGFTIAQTLVLSRQADYMKLQAIILESATLNMKLDNQQSHSKDKHRYVACKTHEYSPLKAIYVLPHSIVLLDERGLGPLLIHVDDAWQLDRTDFL